MDKITYTLIRSDRKTTAIRIRTDGSVEVRAPKRLPVQEIERFLAEKRSWIETHRKAMLERYPDNLEPRRILYMGNWKNIQPTDRDRLIYDGETFFAPSDWDEQQLKTALVALMKKLAKTILPPITEEMAPCLKVSPVKVTVTGAKTKWGSCIDGQRLTFSWRLMAAPLDVIECVVWHELCHMREMNHSPRFWALMEIRYPDWRQKRDRLAEVQSWLDAYYR